MPRWSRHSTPEALKDRERRQTDRLQNTRARTHTRPQSKEKKHTNMRSYTRTETHDTSERHPQSDAANPAAVGGGGGGSVSAGRRVAAQGQTSPWLPTGLIDHCAPLPPVFSPFFFSICISVLLFPPGPFLSPFTFHPRNTE